MTKTIKGIKVKELIAELKKCDPEKKVRYIFTDDNGFNYPNYIITVDEQNNYVNIY